jgi:hypothetical protein
VPSAKPATIGLVVFIAVPQVVVICVLVMVADQNPAPVVMVGALSFGEPWKRVVPVFNCV